MKVPSQVMPTRMVHLEIDQRAIKGMTNKTLDRQTSLVADSWIIVPVSCWSVSEVITSNATA
ncbi:AAEL003096-PA [Aedes aegypti]|uniref:AAEL003096-PA n=1 Tax=Aedes aegypti TaxID=7159 RepID=Q17GE8_AEDAE|nr:AAEL003096-PA [Aedes aegypti]